MDYKSAAALVAIATVALASCGDKGQPKGQVVARVGNSEVTILDLKGELGNFRAPDAKTQKLAEQRALNSIVQRKVIAQEARKQKLDRTPEYVRQRERMDEILLDRTWQDQLARAVPAPSPDEVQQFVGQHPDIYAARKRIGIETIQFAAPADPALSKALAQLKTLDEVRALLTAQKVPFRGGNAEIDALATDPRLIDQLMKMKPNDIFIMPQNNSVLVGHATSVRVDPVSNDLAIRHATEYLKQQRTKEAVYRRFGGIVQAGLKNVKYAKGYEPPPLPKAASAPAARPVPAPVKSN